MSADRIARERRRLRIKRHDLAVRKEAELDERLEAVADTEDQPLSLLQKFHDRLSDARISERRRDELARAVRLVTARETAWQHEDLRLVDARGDRLHRFFDGLRREIANDERIDFAARLLKGALRLVLAVDAGKNRHEDAWLRIVITGSLAHAAAERRGCRGRPAFAADRRREDAVKRTHIRLAKLVECLHHPVADDARNRRRAPEERPLDAGERIRHVDRLAHLQENRTIGGTEEIFKLDRARRCLETKAVAQAHLRQGCRDAAPADARRRKHAAALHQCMHALIVAAQVGKNRKIVRINRHLDSIDLAVRVLEFGGNRLARFHEVDGKGDDRRRHMETLKCARHRILAADGRHAKLMLRP